MDAKPSLCHATGDLAVSEPADLVLYSTDACHLCEQALDMLLGMSELAGRQLEVIDIAADDDLVARFGESIPVLQIGASRLYWPFGPGDVLVACEGL